MGTSVDEGDIERLDALEKRIDGIEDRLVRIIELLDDDQSPGHATSLQ